MKTVGARSAVWRIASAAAVGLAGVLSILATGTAPPGSPPPEGSDSSPPLLRLGSAGLQSNVLLTQDSTLAETRRAKRTDRVVFLATATDAESGVRNVAIRGEVYLECIPTASNAIVRIVDPIAEVRSAPGGQTSLPGQLAVQFNIVPDQRVQCPSGSVFYQVRTTLRAEAENGRGGKRLLPDAVVRTFGPDTVRVATFNMYNPGRHPDEIFERWGRTAASLADVIFLQEAPDLRRVQLVTDAASMPYVVYDTNTAIASRRPIRNAVRRNVSGSIIISGATDLGGYEHQIIGVHFTTDGSPGRVPWWPRRK